MILFVGVKFISFPAVSVKSNPDVPMIAVESLPNAIGVSTNTNTESKGFKFISFRFVRVPAFPDIVTLGFTFIVNVVVNGVVCTT